MWILSCSGDLLNGKRSWLRPGSVHLLGRTSGRGDGEHIRFIDHKSVSRKHLLIRVDPVTESDTTSLHLRTGIELVDGSKSGTFINGEKIKQTTRRLEDGQCTIRLGTYEQQFVLEWRPVVIANSALSKAGKKSIELRRLAGTDVKMTQAYITNETTHVIAKKRNTPTVIQAVLNARWIVTDAWLDALSKSAGAVASTERNEPTRSLLEEDFDAHWPKEDLFAVPAGAEPVSRADHYMAPQQERANVFQGMTFVFLSQAQYDTLFPVVAGGGGKAVVCPVIPQRTTAAEILQFIKSLDHKDSHNEFTPSRLSDDTSAVVVRLNDGDDPWIAKMHYDVDLGLRRRSMEQNEFLDAVLCNDASSLRQPLKSAPCGSHASQSLQELDTNHEQGIKSQEIPAQASSHENASKSYKSATFEDASSQPANASSDQSVRDSKGRTSMKRRNRHIVTQSRFKGFDDFDMSDFTRPASISPEPQSLPKVKETPLRESSSGRMSMTPPPQTSNNTGKKREVEVLLDADEVDQGYDSLLQGQAALKRRRLDLGGTASFDTSEGDNLDAKPALKKAVPPLKGADVVAQLQAHRAKEEEDRLRKEETSRRQLTDINIEDMKDLAIVEYMDVPKHERSHRAHAKHAADDERWDPKWNGRKNFKRFRRQGQKQDVPRIHRVMIALEEVPRRGHGAGDEFWLQSTAETSTSQKSTGRSTTARSSRSKNNSNQFSNQTASSVAEHPDPSDNQSGQSDLMTFQRRVKNSRLQDAATDEDTRLYAEEIAGRPRDETIESALLNTATPTTMAGDSQAKSSGKRPATQQIGAPAKRLRETRPTAHAALLGLDDEDDDDALKFRRRRR